MNCPTCKKVKCDLDLLKQYIEMAPNCDLDRLNAKAIVENLLKHFEYNIIANVLLLWRCL
jgi:hypothetical protein